MAKQKPADIHDPVATTTPSRDVSAPLHALSYLPYLDYGTVVHCVPLHRVYHVQPYRGGPIRICKLLTRGPTGLLGPYDADTIPPLTPVWFINVPDMQYGYIIGCEPPFLTSGNQFYGDAIVRGDRVGMDEEPEYQLPYAAGAQIPVFSGRTPVDSLEAGEFCRVAETGTMFFLDSFMAVLRAGDTCGVIAHLPNRLLRLLGRHVQLWSAISAEERYLSPQGLSVLIGGVATNTLEGLGVVQDPSGYDPSAPLNPSRLSPYGRPVYRDLTLQGGLVDGEAKFVFGVEEQKNQANYGTTIEYPLSVVYRSYNGQIIQASCSGIHLVKTNKLIGFIPAQPVTSQPETAHPKDAYAPTNILTTGDRETDADVKPINILDQQYLLLRQYLGKGASRNSAFVKTESKEGGPIMGFGEINAERTLARPTPAYQEYRDAANRRASISENTGYIGILDDGSVCLSDGWGAEIRLSRGCVYITAPLDIYIDAGRNVVHFAGRDAILKAYKSLDLSTSQGDMRLKAEKNLHVLGANAGGDYGVLIESRSTSTTGYQEGLGTAARYPGVNIVANQSNIICKAENVASYAESSIIESAPAGMIARSGDKIVDRTSCAIVQVFEYDDRHRSYREIENCEELEQISQAHGGPRYNIFTYQSSVFEGELLVKGDMAAYNDIVIGGHTYIAGDCLIDSQFARNTRAQIKGTGDTVKSSIESNEATNFLKSNLPIYAANLFFTCRVDADYANEHFVYPEGRWVAQGIHEWTEPPVKVKFVDPTCTKSSKKDEKEHSTWPFPGARYYDGNATPLVTSEPNINSNMNGNAYKPHVTKAKMDRKARLG